MEETRRILRDRYDYDPLWKGWVLKGLEAWDSQGNPVPPIRVIPFAIGDLDLARRFRLRDNGNTFFWE